jgi:hypothetical protein
MFHGSYLHVTSQDTTVSGSAQLIDFFWENRGVTESDVRSDLLALLKEHRMVLFVGAGLSFKLGYPLWNGYLDRLEEELVIAAPEEGQDPKAVESDPLIRAERIKRAFTDAQRQDDYYAHIEKAFGPKPTSPYTQLQLGLLRFGFRGAITTNFDPSLENAFTVQNLAAGQLACIALDLGGPRPFAVFDFLRDAACGVTSKFVLHLHGVYSNPEGVVLAASDYDERYGDIAHLDVDGRPAHRSLDDPTRKVIWALLATHPTLFVGFSLSDPALRHILSVTSADFRRGRHLDHYAILGSGSQEEERKSAVLARGHGITPVFYRITRSNDLPEDHSDLEALVAGLGADLGLDTGLVDNGLVDTGLDRIGALTETMLGL